MKILKIMGRNLASLEHFELDFEAEPLCSTGLFGISGPTGAGKSTLLDALCLALYNQTPRLNGDGKGAKILDSSGDALEVKDVLSLVRRGAVEALVEVTFVGRDRAKYKASWEVHRAGKKTTGSFQRRSWQLIHLSGNKTHSPGEILCNEIKKTKPTLEEKIGLSFEQFVRAVILPQGEFAAFLKANAKDRAELLEKMTGTEHYSEISRQAYKEAAWWKNTLKEAERDLQAIPQLTPEALQNLETKLAETQKRAQALADQEVTVQAELHWHDTFLTLEQTTQKTQKALEEATRALELAASDQHLLETLEQAQPTRPALEAYDHARAAETQAQNAHTQAQTHLKETQQKELATQQALTTATQGIEAAQERQRILQPELKQARDLDAELKSSRSQRDEAQKRTLEAQKAASEAFTALGACQAELTTQRTARQAAETWKTSHAQDAQLETHWFEWKPALDNWDKAQKELKQLQITLATIQKQLESTRAAHARALQDHQTAQTQTLAAKDTRDHAQAQVDEIDESALQAEQNSSAQTLRLLESLQRIAQDARDATQEGAQAQEIAQAARATIHAAQAGQASALSAKQGLEPQLEEATLDLERRKTGRSLEEHRSQLTEGTPCPLCGATSHPYAGGIPSSLLEDAQKRRDTLELELKSKNEELQQHAITLASANIQLKVATQTHETAQKRLEQTEHTWQQTLEASPLRLMLGEDPADSTLEPRLQTLHEEAVQIQKTLEARVKDLGERRKDATQAQKQHEAAAALEKQLESTLRTTEDSVRKAEQEQQALTRDQERVQADMTSAKARLTPALETFSTLAMEHANAPQQLLKALDARRTAWKQNEERLQNLGAECVRLEGMQGILQPQVDSTTQQLTDRLAELEQASRQHEEQKSARAQLLEGQTVEAVEEQLEKALHQATQALDAARTAHTSASQDAGTARGQLETRAEALEASRTHRVEMSARLTEALEHLMCTEAQLRAWLGYPESERLSLRKRLEGLRQTQSDAQAQHSQAARQQQSHETHRPEASREAVSSHLKALKAEKDQLHAQSGRLEQEREVNAQNQARALEARLELGRKKQEAQDWLTLDLVIGSADGAKLRKLAQSLTLERLLGSSNLQLQELAPRYRLERIPAAELELQVRDLDMGGEVRSINTLSGGEGFLVSLALALGLASLTSGGSRIESLFIDEGFGSLDPETLDCALSVLDGLQAAGRQVGVISHVPGLAERLAVQVRVEPLGQGRSRVVVPKP